MRCLDTITDSIDMNLSKLQELVEDKGALCATVHGLAKSWTRLRTKVMWVHNDFLMTHEK